MRRGEKMARHSRDLRVRDGDARRAEERRLHVSVSLIENTRNVVRASGRASQAVFYVAAGRATRRRANRDGVAAIIDYREIIKRSWPREEISSYGARSKGHSRDDRTPPENLHLRARRNIVEEQNSEIENTRLDGITHILEIYIIIHIIRTYYPYMHIYIY